MDLVVDVFWSFRSPYSYLATPRLVEMARVYTVDLRIRPVLPLAVRVEGFFDRANPLWLPYLGRDVVRIAQMEGIPFGPPRPDPIVQEFPSRKVAAEQPYIHRLTRLGVAAAEAGRGLPFISEVSHLIWSGTVVGWNEGDHLAKAAARAGVDLASLDAKISAEPARYDALIEANQQALTAAGHWGVPTFVFQGEPFFGQDRLDVLRWRLGLNGLRRRDGAPL